MQNMLPIKEARRLTGLAQSTLRRLHATGEFVPQMITKKLQGQRSSDRRKLKPIRLAENIHYYKEN